MGYEPLEEKRIYQRAESLANRIWTIATAWEWFAKKTIGTQLVRAVDSIGANIAEASGRFHPNDVRTFLYYARGSLQETKYWLRQACARQLLSEAVLAESLAELEQLGKELNMAINHQKTRTATRQQPPNHLTT